jgi:tocopherol O-methyltransferase
MIRATGGRQDEWSIATHYDQLDPFYRALWGEHVHHGLWLNGRESAATAQTNLVDLVAQHLDLSKPGARICDVGCGYGGTTRHLAMRWGAETTGLTISKAQYEYARAQAGDDPASGYLLRSWLVNELSSESFDGVLAIESVAHIADKAKTFREAARVLKPGGRLVVCDWLTSTAPSEWQARYLIGPICREARIPHLASGHEYQRLIEAGGLVVTARADLSRQVRRTWTTAIGRVISGLATNPSMRRYLRDPRSQDRGMALAMLRMPLAYRIGCMKYELIAAERPAEGS